jgi:hypothetical protein
MPVKRTFHVVWVGRNHGVGEAVASDADTTVTYEGKAVEVRVQ